MITLAALDPDRVWWKHRFLDSGPTDWAGLLRSLARISRGAFDPQAIVDDPLANDHDEEDPVNGELLEKINRNLRTGGLRFHFFRPEPADEESTFDSDYAVVLSDGELEELQRTRNWFSA